MRPAKKILVLSSNEDRLSRFSFVLRTHLYKVTAAATIVEARERLSVGDIDLFLIDLPAPGVESLLESPYALGFPPSLAINARPGTALAVDAIYTYRPSAADLLEQMKVITARKRGPRRTVTKPPARETQILIPPAEKFLAAELRLGSVA